MDILNVDIWGPLDVLTMMVLDIFLTLVDDKSHFTRIYLLKNKI